MRGICPDENDVEDERREDEEIDEGDPGRYTQGRWLDRSVCLGFGF